MKALVIGGAGYIGSHMVRALQRAGHDVAIFDNFSTGHRAAVEGLKVYEGDLLNPADLDRALPDFAPDLMLHFAARSLVGESMVEPALYYGNNVCGVFNLLEAMRRHGRARLVFSSTAAVYGLPTKRRIDEDHPTQPINTYGWSKLFAERMIEDACRSYGLRAAVLRYFNAAGADDAGDIGEAHEPETHLLPNILRVAAGKAPLVRLFGSDYDTRDGYCVRDFIHVSDLCDAHLLAANALEKADLPAYQLYNLGNGQGFSVLEVLRAAEVVVGRPIPSEVGPARAGDPPVLVAGASKARSVLGWAPQKADLTQIIASAWRWHQAQRY
ncbi:UDP-glucose 4-epimerase [Hydrocarboniphaga daqingensis]|uniref:UDP-glucose 4-epimerase n=1 Tax=Hydrocarboniphaga daqingensis TaxID=490188 RepID=A0A1M5LZW1_9GAMM|nr:UDP-glucose 4-epimerase GalE [Hydrocarboniphaga daqingensis]SHG70634.1 UDP-glucose 4-epimerase [Hydrocarboniphaga daqingensis]